MSTIISNKSSSTIIKTAGQTVFIDGVATIRGLIADITAETTDPGVILSELQLFEKTIKCLIVLNLICNIQVEKEINVKIL